MMLINKFFIQPSRSVALLLTEHLPSSMFTKIIKNYYLQGKKKSSTFIISAQCSLPDSMSRVLILETIFIFRLCRPIDYTPCTHKQRTSQKVQETLHNLQLSSDWPVLIIMIKRQQYIFVPI